LQALTLYIELEQLRFDQSFEYKINVAEEVEPMRAQLPPMMLQPYVENAIWHGLLHRAEPGGRLLINISLTGKQHMSITIEDNGVGRKASDELKSRQRNMHKQSHGIQITEERLERVNALYQLDARATIEDLVSRTGEPSGTRVVLTLKYQQHENHSN
jgi:sensor histidine kinase YesM